MIIETTISINTDNEKLLSVAAIRTKVSEKNIISSLLRRLSMDFEEMVVPWKRIRYQKRNASKTLVPLHLSLMPDEYEFFLDLRKSCKMSVSHLVAYALRRYLDEVVSELINGSDNYRYSNYTLSYVVYKGVVCLIQYWGLAEMPLSRHVLNALEWDTLTYSSA